MKAVCLKLQDLGSLAQLVPDLRFDDAERQAALLENGSRDFNAVPGSGKTSLLAAKLLLLAKNWPYPKKGICVLSHTNVAREEITRRLSQSVEGLRLLSYPHFIGTIHGFVNQFLAMTALRHLDLKVDVIDDAVFSKRAWSLATSNTYATLRAWLGRQQNAEVLISGLFFKNATLDVISEGGVLPGADSTTYKQMVALKLRLASAGVFRHRDMFAFAELALAEHKHLLDVVHRRFPMVFIDEMQDTSWEQEHILNRLFDGKSVVQRFGDVDQKIIVADPDGHQVTFPRQGHGTISTSKRFGQRIADAVARVRVSQLPVVGEADDGHNPVLMLYKTADINRVVYRFGQLVIDRFDQVTLESHLVRAMCARRSGEGKVDVGRHIADYWPAFNQVQHAAKDSLHALFQAQSAMGLKPTLSERTNDVRRGVLLVLRAAKAPVTDDLRDGRALLRAVRERGGDTERLQKLIRELTLNPPSLASRGDRLALASTMYSHLSALLPQGMTAETFSVLELFGSDASDEGNPTPSEPATVCTLVHSGRELGYSLGTVAGMKGETHIASLVMESYGGVSRRFDIQVALPFIAGIGKKFDRLSATQQAQMRNLYVAMSRPTQFLCLAANDSRVDAQTLEALVAKGWNIDHA